MGQTEGRGGQAAESIRLSANFSFVHRKSKVRDVVFFIVP
jgi:hypothetical protein